MTDKPEKKPLYKRLPGPIIFLWLTFVTVGTASVWVASADSALSLFTHFVPLYFVCTLAVLPVALLLRRRKAVVVAVVLALLQGWLLLPYVPMTGAAHAAEEPGVHVRVLVANVQAYNRHKGRLAPMIMDHDPDIIVLLETTESWLENSRNLLVAYPHHVGLPLERGAGISVYSRLPIGKRDVVYPGDVGMPAILAEVHVGMQAVSMMAVHNVPPLPLSYLPRGVKQMEAVANIANAAASPFMLVGDLNTSMWGPTYRYLIEKTGLKNSREGFGIAGTFPEALAPVLVPIDHVLVDDAWSVRGTKVGEGFGSDHLPLVVDLRLKPAA